MAHIRTWHDVFVLLVRSSAPLVELVLGLVLFVTTLMFLVRLARVSGVGRGSGAVRARARIEADLRAQTTRRTERPAGGETDSVERALRRKLASVEVILARSTFEGERAAAIEARDRLKARLGVGRLQAAPSPDAK